MGDGGRMIIIRGGRGTSIVFDTDLFGRDPLDPKHHRNPNLEITRIRIHGDDGSLLYDSTDHPEGLNHEVRVFCR